MLCLSAHDSGGIERQARLLANYLHDHHGKDLMDDLVFTLGQRRSLHKYRYAIQSDSLEDLQSSLRELVYTAPTPSRSRRLAFLFTGQGAQWPRMGCELLAAYPIFYDTFRAADKYLSSLGATWSLLGILGSLFTKMVFSN